MTAGRLIAIALVAVAFGAVAVAQAPGDAGRGQDVFAGKHCVRCHQPRGQPGVGPPLEALRRPQGAYELAGRLWNHAPGMFTVLKHEGIDWPRINDKEMADLMAYLLADPSRDPPPDAFKGQVTLVGKGCLKCHSWRKEGGRIGPDLAEQRPSYTSAAMWCAAMWTHTPRMAAAALQQGVLYPRFTGDEMAHLIGYLQRGAARP
jgi:mono/diheme cytochrome c family protein